MKNYFFTAIFFLLLFHLQGYPQQFQMLPEVTPAGKGRVNTKIDNIGYWYRMVSLGYVKANPVLTIPNARFNGTMTVPSGDMEHSPAKPSRELPMLPQNSPDVPVTGETGVTQSENAVFIDPSDDDILLNSNNSTTWILGAAQDIYGADALYSTDAGLGWGGSVHGTDGANNGDPSTAIGLNGWWYLGMITGDYGQAVSRSQDQGKTWTRVKVGNGPVSGNGLLDKNHLWIDNSPASPYNGYLYDAWTNMIPGAADTNQVELTRSADHGVTWSLPANISSAASALQLNHGVNINTGPAGEVYVAWSIYDAWPADENAIGFAKSLNGGGSFAPATRIINNIKGIRATMTGKAMRVNSFPSMAVDNSTGPNRGHIYLVWSNVGYPGINTGTDIDVYLIRSSDGGNTWSAPIRVNQDPAGHGKQHFSPWITCDAVTGGLCVIYYDDRNLPATDAAVFVSWSYDGGLSWSDMQVSDYSFTPSPIPGLAYNYFGDYIGIQSHNMNVYPVWTDNHDNDRPMTYTSPFFLGPNPNQPWVMYWSNTLAPVQGGGNVNLNYGDSLFLTLGLKNVGDQRAVGVNAFISTASPYVTITDSTAAYGNIDSAQVKTIPDGFTFKVSDTIPDNLSVRFNLRVTSIDSSWYSHFSIEAHAPAPKITGITVVDTLTGNRNGRLDPGETVQLVVSNTNTGDYSCRSAYARLTTTSPYLTLLNDSVFLDSIGPGQSRNAVFNVQVSMDAPTGTGADLLYAVHSGLYHAERPFREMIGIIIEDWESGTLSKFPWHSGGTLPWTITNQNPWEGIYCARSGAIPDYASSQLWISYPSAVDDSISFYLRTSTEDGADFLLFYTDGVLQGQWSGETPWNRVAFPVAAGDHLFKWIYHKDLSFAGGEDRTMIDFIVFPPPVLPSIVPSASDSLCAGTAALLHATVALADSLKWTTTGDGMFANDTLPVTTYTPGPADEAAGKVTCRLTAFGAFGNSARNTLVVIRPRPAANITVFPHDTICAWQSVRLSADTTGNAGYLWTPGNLHTPEAVYDSASAGGMGTHLVRLAVTSRFQCQNRDSVYITFKDCMGICENRNTAWTVYPNPNNGIFQIVAGAGQPVFYRLSIQNALNETVYEEEVPVASWQPVKKLTLNFLTDGVYLLTLTTTQGASSQKFIIRK